MLGRLANKRLPNVKYMVVDAADMPFSDSIDLAFWGTNMHDIYNEDGETATLQYLNDIKRALKPGGILAVSDHVGVAGNDNAELHRLEPRIIMDLLNKAGFIVEATSDLLGNPKDDHRLTQLAGRYEIDGHAGSELDVARQRDQLPHRDSPAVALVHFPYQGPQLGQRGLIDGRQMSGHVQKPPT